MQNVSVRVKGLRYVTAIPSDDYLYQTVVNVKRFGRLGDLAAVAGLSERSLYRYASDDPAERPTFTPDTRWALAGAFEAVGLLGDYELGDLRAAMGKLAGLAKEKRATPAEGVPAPPTKHRPNGKGGKRKPGA